MQISQMSIHILLCKIQKKLVLLQSWYIFFLSLSTKTLYQSIIASKASFTLSHKYSGAFQFRTSVMHR